MKKQTGRGKIETEAKSQNTKVKRDALVRILNWPVRHSGQLINHRALIN
jgi:hypothetical protein